MEKLKKSMLFGFFMLFILSITSFGAEQIVVTTLDTTLKDSSSYTLSGVTINGSAYGAYSDNNTIGDVVDFGHTFVNGFTGSTSLTYAGTLGKEKLAIIPVTKNTSATSVVEGNFSLKTTSTNSDGDTVTNYLIDEDFTLPMADTVKLTKSSASSSGVKFTYTESSAAKKAHLNAYKNQEYLIRIVSGTTEKDYDLLNKTNGIALATKDEGYLTSKGYMDFIVTADQYDSSQNIKSSSGSYSLNFLPGNIEVYGLPSGNYIVEVYSFRYTEDSESTGSCVITKEDSLSFNNTEDSSVEGIYVKDFSTENFPTNAGTILTVTDANSTLSSISITELKSSSTIYTGTSTSYTSVTSGGSIYQTWDVSYTLTTGTAIDSEEHTVTFSGTGAGGNMSTTLTYKPSVQSSEVVTDYPHQTVFQYTGSKTWSGNYVINDRELNKYTYGYRQVKAVNSGTTPANMYLGDYTSSSTMNFDNSSYSWVGNGDTSKALLINKVISNSKGTITGTAGTYTYYTTEGISDLAYTEESNSTKDSIATFTWTSPEKSSYSTTLTQDKILFRIAKVSSSTDLTNTTSYTVNGVSYSTDLPKYYYNPSENTYPIIKGNEPGESTATTALDSFVDSSSGYIDLIFDANTGTSVTSGDVTFSYSTSNRFVVNGLSRGNYLVQVYTLQNADSSATSDYKVLTYGGYSSFEMGLPTIATGDFSSKNNVFIINNIDYTSGYDTSSNSAYKKVNLEFVTKAQQSLDLKINNLVARNDEGTTEGSIKYTAGEMVTEQRNYTGNYEATTNIALSESKSEFQFPVDIVLCIDNSGSMQNEINAVKNHLEEFAEELEEKGFDVKFNLITFGSAQDYNYGGSYGYAVGSSWYSTIKANNGFDNKVGSYNYLATFKAGGNWFSSVSELQGALGSLTCPGGFAYNQENGIWAIDKGISYLNSYGRYLNSSNEIVEYNSTNKGSSPIASQKMIIFLTDENADVESLPSTDYTSTTAHTVLSNKLSDGGINLVGLYHTGVYSTAVKQGTISGGNGAGYNGATGAEYLANISGATSGTAQYFSISGVNYYINTDSSGYKYITFTNDSTSVETIAYLYTSKSGSKVSSVSTGSKYYLLKGTSWTSQYTLYNNSSLITFEDSLGHSSRPSADYGNLYYTRLAFDDTGDVFTPYEMGDNGEFIDEALSASTSKLGIVQTWKLDYTSPFGDSDGLDREVIFSLDNLPTITQWSSSAKAWITTEMAITPVINSGDRIYNVTQEKIEASFENPDPSTCYLVKKDGYVTLKAIAQSEYRDNDGKLVNYPIIKGTFVIIDDITGATYTVTSTDSSSEKVTITDFTNSSGDLWYRSTSPIKEANFKSAFPNFDEHTFTVQFTAETSEDTKTISLSGVQLVDGDEPVINAITLTNSTLANFMNALGEGTTFTTSEVALATETTTVTSISGTGGAISFGTSALNVKDGDSIDVEFTIEDESIIPTAGGFVVTNVTSSGGVETSVGGLLTVTYNGNNYSLSGGNVTNTSYNSSTGVSKWKVTGLTYSKDVNDFSVEIVDGSLLSNTTNATTSAFQVPDTVENTEFIGNTSNVAGTSYSNYYNTKLSIENKSSYASNEPLGYLVVFDYDSSKRDTTGTALSRTDKTYQTVNSKTIESVKYSSSASIKFNDGYYDYAKVYAFNKAGAIVDVTSTTINTLSTVVDKIYSGDSRTKNFYVDTIAPQISEVSFYKSADANSELNSSSIATAVLLGEGKPYKVNDSVGVSASLWEYNFLYSKESSSTSENIATNSQNPTTYAGTATNSSAIAYIKSGTANDQTSGNGEVSITSTVTFYDKAGNISTKDITATYDDRIPSTVVTSYGAIGTTSDSTPVANRKYTKNTSIPLVATSSAVPFSVGGIVSGGTLSYIGNISSISTSNTVNLTSFSSYSSTGNYIPTENSLNEFELTTYSHSGQKYESKSSNSYSDNIVLDTKINYGTTSITKTLKENYDLGSFIGTVTELVGLESFQIKKESGPTSTLAYSAGTSGTLTLGTTYGTIIPIRNAKYYSTLLTSSIYSTDSYTLQFTGVGTYVYTVKLYDRLGNSEEYTFTLTYSNNPIDIIGKTNESSIELTSKANQNDGKIRIESRTER